MVDRKIDGMIMTEQMLEPKNSHLARALKNAKLVSTFGLAMLPFLAGCNAVGAVLGRGSSANTPTPTTESGEGVKATATPTAAEGIRPAERSGNAWVLRHPDEDKTIEVTLPDGFTPDKNLHLATDITALAIGVELNTYKDWETALNTKRAGGALAGYNYDYNDWCPTADYKCNVQSDMYAWRTLQGEELGVPGIGTLKGGPRRSVVLNVLNLGDSIHAWDLDKNGQVLVKRGFTATGRIFDGQNNVNVLEQGLSGHWAFRQLFGIPEKSYIGITDSPDNALEVLMASVQRKQWGFNSDGSKRMEFQLMRADLLKKGQGGAVSVVSGMGK